MENMKWVVEARIYDNGMVKTRVYEVPEDMYIEPLKETKRCDVWCDVFDTKEEAMFFAAEYKNS